jgi:hypothetical protein
MPNPLFSVHAVNYRGSPRWPPNPGSVQRIVPAANALEPAPSKAYTVSPIDEDLDSRDDFFSSSNLLSSSQMLSLFNTVAIVIKPCNPVAPHLIWEALPSLDGLHGQAVSQQPFVEHILLCIVYRIDSPARLPS